MWPWRKNKGWKCPRCTAANAGQFVCLNCGLLTPRAADELLATAEGIPKQPGVYREALKQELHRRGLFSAREIDALLVQLALQDVKKRPRDDVQPAQSRPGSSVATTRAGTHASERETKTVRWNSDEIGRIRSSVEWRTGDVLFQFFRIEAEKQGGFGRVYLCRHTETGEGIAIKTLQVDPLGNPEHRALMLREAELWARLPPHSNVVTIDFVFDSTFDKRLWLGMERIEGHPTRGVTLREWMTTTLDVESIVRIAGGICAAMQHVAASGMVHRDLKPENILLTEDGFAKVTDFGIAQPVASTSGMRVIGTPAYLSPEARDPAQPSLPARDVYAFGVLLWELITGRRIERQEQIPDPRELGAQIPRVLADLARACLTRQPDGRPSFSDIADRLRRDWPSISWSGAPRREGIGVECSRIDALVKLGEFEDAESRLQRALQRDANHPMLHILRIDLFDHLGRLSEAGDSVETVMAFESSNAGALLRKGRALRQVNRHQEALDVVDRGLSIDPEHGWLLLERGQILTDLGRFDEAAAILERGAAHPRESGLAARVHLAKVVRARGQSALAVQHLRTALRGNPNDHYTLRHLADVFGGSGLTEEALDCVDRALAIMPTYLDAHLLKAKICRDAGRIVEAERILRDVIDRAPATLRAHLDLAMLLLATGRSDEARKLFASADAQAVSHDDLFDKAFLVATVFERYRESLDYLNEALARRPSHAGAWILKGDIHIYLDELDRAEACYQRAHDLDPVDGIIERKRQGLAAFNEVNRVWGQHELALAACTRAVQLDPRNARYLFVKGNVLGALNRLAESLESLDKGFELSPRAAGVDVRWLRLRCLLELQLETEARSVAMDLLPLVTDPDRRRWLEQLLGGEPSSHTRQQIAGHWYARGSEAQMTGRLADALECFRRCVYIEPGTPAFKGQLGMTLVLLSQQTSARSTDEEGLALLNDALAKERDPAMLFNYMQALHMAGRLPEAAAVSRELARLTPDDPHLLKVIQQLAAKQSVH